MNFSKSNFNEARFDAYVSFQMSNFVGKSSFSNVSFKGLTRFSGTIFSGLARFTSCEFFGFLWFNNVKFLNGARFGLGTFNKFVSFSDSEFGKEANFAGIDCKSGFVLSKTSFRTVPDFSQAHFAEAPRLDNLNMIGLSESKISCFAGDIEIAARWRALKRLAIQGHDHEREQIFFKGELQARRWVTDKIWHAAFWFGAFYQLLSDFGRSMMRPVIWLTVAWAVGAMLYLHQATGRHPLCVWGGNDA